VTEQRSPEPGWYPDPSGSPNLRWWNGVSWSDSTHPLPGASPQSAPAPAYPTIFGDDPGPATGRRGRGPWVAVAMVVVLLGIAAVAVAFLFSAVSSQTRLDTAVVEQQIAEALSQSSGLTTTVTCPDEVTIATGDTFTCTATTDDGRTAQIEVTQDDDQGNVTWSPVG
jgi:Domain of unknown function (DUF4333)/Protein of unknown function (DUF2510)